MAQHLTETPDTHVYRSGEPKSSVLTRLTAIVYHLAKRNLAFRGHSDRLFEPGNGNFLGQVQLMAQFDPIMREHLRSQDKELSDNYLSKHIQNELISLVAKCTIDAIVEKVKQAKYWFFGLLQ